MHDLMSVMQSTAKVLEPPLSCMQLAVPPRHLTFLLCVDSVPDALQHSVCDMTLASANGASMEPALLHLLLCKD